MARFFSAPKKAGGALFLGLVALAALPSSEAFCGFLNNNNGGNTPRGGTGPLSAKVCTLYNFV